MSKITIQFRKEMSIESLTDVLTVKLTKYDVKNEEIIMGQSPRQWLERTDYRQFAISDADNKASQLQLLKAIAEFCGIKIR